MLRRADFLTEAVQAIWAWPVDVVRGRAEEPAVRSGSAADADFVVSRAVADLEKLTRWSPPLLRTGGRMLAMKGERAEDGSRRRSARDGRVRRVASRW